MDIDGVQLAISALVQPIGTCGLNLFYSLCAPFVQQLVILPSMSQLVQHYHHHLAKLLAF
jgi:hypothetical protein